MRKDGSRFWANIVLTAIYDQNGDFLGYAKLTKDLTVRRAYETHIKNALAEKETLLREVYHRVKNNLQVITSLFNLQMRTLVDEQARLALQQAAERVYAMALVHEKLYQSDNLASIPLDSYIRDLCKHFSSASALGERNISIELELEPMNIDLEKAVPLGLIINELVSNSLKHAFSDGRQGKIKIQLTSAIDNYVQLSITDNGIGMPKTKNSKNTLGLKLISTLCHQLNAVLETVSDGGVRVTVTFVA